MGKTATLTTGYDQLNRPNTVIYPDHQSVTYDYDDEGNLSGLSPFVTVIKYDAARHPIGATYSNGTTATWSWDPKRQWLDDQHVARGTAALYDTVYTHQPNALVRRIASATGQGTETYGYDRDGRLTSTTEGWKQHIDYNDTGNITTNSRLGHYGYGTSRAACPQNAATSGGPHAVTTAGSLRFHYDCAGEMTSQSGPGKRHRIIRWTADGLPRQIIDHTGTTTLRYDADSQLVQRTTHGTSTTIFGASVDWSPRAGYTDYISANGTLFASVHGKDRHWYTTDPQGSIRLITDASGRIIGYANYSPFGEPISVSGHQDARTYAGHRPTSNGELIDMSARYYEPHLGRMLSADTINPTPDAQGLNPYTYALNNPISLVDPTGHLPSEDSSGWIVDGIPWSETHRLFDVGSEQGSRAFSTPATSDYAGMSVAQIVALGKRILADQGVRLTNSSAAKKSLLTGGATLTCELCVSGFAPARTTDASTQGDGAAGPGGAGALGAMARGVVQLALASGIPKTLEDFLDLPPSDQAAALGQEGLSGNVVTPTGAIPIPTKEELVNRDIELEMTAFSGVWSALGAALPQGFVGDMTEYFAGIAMLARPGGQAVASGVGESAPMTVVRIIQRGEKIADIVNEAKSLTWTTGSEHAVVVLADGERALVSGGPGGIKFAEGQVMRILGHTHPTGAPPSAADFAATRALGQSQQTVYHGGQVTKIRPGP